MTQTVKIKRTTIANRAPAPGSLAEGELALNLADNPARMWSGVPTTIEPTGIIELFEDAPDDAVYGRSHGDWVKMPIVSPTPPLDPPPNTLWWDSSEEGGALYIWFDDHWVAASPSGAVLRPPNDGNLYGMRNDVWVPINIPDIPEDVSLVTSAGRMELVGNSPSDRIVYRPYNGSWIRIDGSDHVIPASGIIGYQGGPNTYINGVPSQNLVGSTIYYVYVFDDGGTLKIDFSTTSHETSSKPGNVGTEIKQGDDSRSLIGIVFTASTYPVFYDQPGIRYISSWLNRISRTITWPYSYATTATSITNLFSYAFVNFAGEGWMSLTGSVQSPNATAFLTVGLWVGSTACNTTVTTVAPAAPTAVATSTSFQLFEGLNQIWIRGATSNDWLMGDVNLVAQLP